MSRSRSQADATDSRSPTHVAKRAGRAVLAAADRHGRSHTVLVTIAFALFWVPVIIFAALADEVVEREPIGVDSQIQSWAYASHTPVLDNVFLFATTLGQPFSIVGIGLALFGGLLFTRRLRLAGFLFAGVGGAALANVILKLIFTRTRPTAFPSLLVESGYSFPSGHAMVTSALVFTLVLMLWRTKWRTVALVFGVIVMVMVGASRVYIGVHYPSDVVAGWAVSAVWVVLAGSLILNFPFKLHAYISRLLKKLR